MSNERETTIARPDRQRPRQCVDALTRRQCSGLVEVLALWLLYAYTALAIFITHSRVPASRLYEAGGDGTVGGVVQLLVFTRHPLLPVTLAFLAITFTALLPGTVVRTLVWCALLAIIVSAGALTAVARFGLEAGPIDAVAIWVAVLAIILTARTVSVTSVGRPSPWTRDDALRIVLGAGLLILGVPWLVADLGLFADDVPPLGHVFLSEEFLPTGERLVAVHVGHHHGMDGLLLALTALALSRCLRHLRHRPLRGALSLYLAILLVYGLARAANDFWFEQVVRRGWTTFELPRAVTDGRPSEPWFWGGLLIMALLVHRCWFHRPGSTSIRPTIPTAPPRTVPTLLHRLSQIRLSRVPPPAAGLGRTTSAES